jgi:LacI family transcriptional regulator
MPYSNTPTLRDVARRAGVSVMTASRVLRNQTNVAADTRAAVQAAASDLHYRPNPLVSALMSYRHSSRKKTPGVAVIAMITNFPTRTGWKAAPINVEFFAGASAAAELRGYKLEPFWLREPGMTGRRLSEILFNRNIGGLLIAPLAGASGHLRLDWEKFAAVALGYSLVRPPLHRAVNHQFRSMQFALRLLRKRGYHRPGLALRASYDRRVDHHWVGSFLVEQQRLGKGPLPLLVPPDKDWTLATFREWVAREKPDVIITQHDEVFDWIEEMKLRVPEEIGLVHLNCPKGDLRWAGILQNAQAIGAAAVDHLISMLQRNERGVPELPQYLLIEGSWREGPTVRGPHGIGKNFALRVV